MSSRKLAAVEAAVSGLAPASRLILLGGRLPTLQAARDRRGKDRAGSGIGRLGSFEGVIMSRKAAERRNGEGFVEAHLWVCTRGRPYKPRFAAERAVVLVSGGGAGYGGADTPVAAAANGIVARRAASSAAAASASSSTHPLAALIDAVPRADALFRDTGCEALFVVDYSPLARDLPSELASTFPGKVAKPVGRVMQKLNPRNAVFAASGADAAVLFKAMRLTGDDGAAAVVVAKPGDIPRAGVPREPVTEKTAMIAGEDEGELAEALPNREYVHPWESDAGAQPEMTQSARSSLLDDAVALVYGSAAAADGDNDVSWMGDDAPVFYSRVTFEHDRVSKQIEQKVTALRAEDVRALAEEAMRAKEAKRAAGTRDDEKEEEKKEEEEVEKEVEKEEEEEEPARSRSIPAGSTDISSNAEVRDAAADGPGPIIYVARRPFHPTRLAAALRVHLGAASTELDPLEGLPGDGGGGEVAAATAAASRAAAAAAAVAARAERAFGGSSDPAVAAAAAALASSAAAAAAAAAAATAAARLLSSAETSKPAATSPSSGPFRGVTRSAGVVWLASRPAQSGVWTTDEETGRAAVSCHGDWTNWTPDRGGGDVVGGFRIDRDELARWVGDARQELVFEGDATMDPERLRAALDACLLTESEMGGSDTNSGGADMDDIFCFSPWPERDAHLASLGVHAGGRGSRAISMAAAKKGMWSGLWKTCEPCVTEGEHANAQTRSGESERRRWTRVGGESGSEKTVKKVTGAAALGFGGPDGVRVPEAFVAPPRGVDVRQFPDGKGHFWPKMPCLECGSPWWLGDDWDATCANCGGDAESYDNDQRPHREYRRRFERFRRLVDDLVANRGSVGG